MQSGTVVLYREHGRLALGVVRKIITTGKAPIEIIGADQLDALDPETLYFITATLNKLDLKKIRNNIIIKTLPYRV